MDDKIEISEGIFLSKLKDTDIFSSFDCEDDDINEFLKEDALDHIEKDLAIVYAIKEKQNKVLAYSTLSMSTIKIKSRGDVPYPQIPALLLGRLGVDKDSKLDASGNKNYYGYTLIDYCTILSLVLKKSVGCCYLVVHAYPDMVDYYGRVGFETEETDKKINKHKNKKDKGKKFRNIPMYFRLEDRE